MRIKRRPFWWVTFYLISYAKPIEAWEKPSVLFVYCLICSSCSASSIVFTIHKRKLIVDLCYWKRGCIWYGRRVHILNLYAEFTVLYYYDPSIPHGLSVSLTMVYKLLGTLPLQTGFHGWVVPMDLYQSLLKTYLCIGMLCLCRLLSDGEHCVVCLVYLIRILLGLFINYWSHSLSLCAWRWPSSLC